jgi:DNA-directed RNA polymerase subunit M/transcription elongation factor TFIIS
MKPQLQEVHQVAVSLECPRCHTKQAAYVKPQHGFDQMSNPQMVVCAGCHNEFQILIPDRVIDGPFAG